MSVARLGELLSEREALRNEALLLLGALSRGSSEAQKMLAFEGAFDRLLSIIREEGGLEGGEVVQVRPGVGVHVRSGHLGVHPLYGLSSAV